MVWIELLSRSDLLHLHYVLLLCKSALRPGRVTTFLRGSAMPYHLKRTVADSVAPVVTADTYFACDSMKYANAQKNVVVFVLGQAAKNDVNIVFSGATAYGSFANWSGGSSDGYVEISSGSWTLLRDEGRAAHNAGY